MLVGSGVALAVYSTDQRLVALCREVLRELGDTLGELESSLGGGVSPSTSEVCLWDCESAGFLPESGEFGNSRVLYLVPPGQVESLLLQEPGAEGHVLLKPVTRAVLRAFLVSAVPSTSAAPVDTVDYVGTLRANRDELLQRLLHANLRLQEYDQQRTNFIARAVHDFRAPLDGSIGILRFACQRGVGSLG